MIQEMAAAAGGDGKQSGKTPEQFGNNPDTELLWAQKAGKHSDVHWQLLQSMKSKKQLILTKSVSHSGGPLTHICLSCI